MTILTSGRAGTSQFTIFLNLNFKWQAEIVLVRKRMCGFRPPQEQRNRSIGTTWKKMKQNLTWDVNTAG
jgi:hypothetical protein